MCIASIPYNYYITQLYAESPYLEGGIGARESIHCVGRLSLFGFLSIYRFSIEIVYFARRLGHCGCAGVLWIKNSTTIVIRN